MKAPKGYTLKFLNGGWLGRFASEKDAQRYLDDNPRLKASVIPSKESGPLMTWGAECPVCKIRAQRDFSKSHAPEHKTDTRLAWKCLECNLRFSY